MASIGNSDPEIGSIHLEVQPLEPSLHTQEAVIRFPCNSAPAFIRFIFVGEISEHDNSDHRLDKGKLLANIDNSDHRLDKEKLS